MKQHLLRILMIELAVSAVYLRVTPAHFCSFDDYADAHRAAFEDTQEPSRMFTTTHFNTPKYRPFERVLIWGFWQAGGGSPVAFRIRNLGFHLVTVASLYGSAFLIFQSAPLAAGAALLYGLHPLANQAVNGAMWSISPTYGLLMASFFLFLLALYDQRHWKRWLGLSLVTVFVNLFIYEAIIVVFGFLYVFLILWWWQGRPIPKALPRILVGATAVCILALWIVRQLFVAIPPPVVTPVEVVKNLTIYAGAMLLPFDSLLANRLFGTPLPSEIRFSPGLLLAVPVVLLVVSGLIWLAYRTPGFRARVKQTEWWYVGFFALTVVFTLTPFLVFTPKISETYLYLPVGLYCVVLSALLWRLLPSARWYGATVALLAVSFASATFVRNGNVARCGEIAESIFTQFPLEQWRTGEWNIRVSPPPGDPLPPRYGLYNVRGIGAIDNGPTLGLALQTATGNTRIKATMVQPEELRDCDRPGICFWVTTEGKVTDAVSGGGPN